MNLKKGLLVLILSTLLFIAVAVGYDSSRQAVDAKQIKYRYNPNDRHEHPYMFYVMSKEWLNQYLSQYKRKGNRIDPIPNFDYDYKIIDTAVEDESIWVHVNLKVDADEIPKDLFKTQASVSEGQFIYDMVIHFDITQANFRYVEDLSLEAFDSLAIRQDSIESEDQTDNPETPPVTDQDHLIDLSSKYLKVREDKEAQWIATTVYNNEFREGHINERRIDIQGERIAIVYGIDQLNLALSRDAGQSWVHYIMNQVNEDLSYYSYASLDIEDSQVTLVAKFNVALNAEVQRIYKTEDFGKTWSKGFISQNNSKLLESVAMQDRVFFTKKESNDLFYTDDLGATINEAKLPPTDSIEGPYANSGLDWEQVYVQASIPERDGDDLVILLHQGELKDFEDQSAIRYRSFDHGETWVFDEHLIIKEDPNKD